MRSLSLRTFLPVSGRGTDQVNRGTNPPRLHSRRGRRSPGRSGAGFLEEGALQGHLGGGVSLGSSKEEHPRRSKDEKRQRWGKRGDFRALTEMGDGRVTKGKSDQCSPLGTGAHSTVFLGGI